jgi:hypothetical protein
VFRPLGRWLFSWSFCEFLACLFVRCGVGVCVCSLYSGLGPSGLVYLSFLP